MGKVKNYKLVFYLPKLAIFRWSWGTDGGARRGPSVGAGPETRQK